MLSLRRRRHGKPGRGMQHNAEPVAAAARPMQGPLRTAGLTPQTVSGSHVPPVVARMVGFTARM